MPNSKLRILLILFIFLSPIILNAVNADQAVAQRAVAATANESLNRAVSYKAVSAPVNESFNRAISRRTVPAKANESVSRLIGPINIARGHILVTSNPTKAEVFVDGVSKGFANPSLNLSLTAGTHKVLCRLAGYNDNENEVKVARDVTTRLICKLVPSPGNIFITSDPSGAEVLLDGTSRGLANPTLNIPGLNPGSHKVLCRLAGYKDRENVVTVVSGVTTSVVCNLLTSTGNISVTSDPSGSEVLVDGTAEGLADPTLDISGLNPGSHKVLCRLAGYKDFDIDVTVHAGITTPVPCTLVPLGTATISMVAEPARIKPNQDAKIVISVTGPDGSPLSQADVAISSVTGGSFDKSEGMTDNQGRLSSNFTAGKEGKYVVKAVAKTAELNEISKEVTVEVSSSASLPVEPIQPTGYNPSITSIFAVSMITALAVYLRARRGR